MGKHLIGLVALFVAKATTVAAAPENYHVLKTIPFSTDGGWDYLTVDGAARRVYVSHSTRVEVLDADTGEIKGQIPDTAGVHGIAVASDLGRGFTSNGRTDNVTVFDLKTLKPLGTIPTGKNPDCIIYDPLTHRVFAFNGRDASVTVIDAAEKKAVGTIALGGQPEFATTDGAGHVFVNLEDKNEVLRLDAKELKVLDRWPLKDASAPCSMAIDAANHRLFVGCRSKSLVVLNADSGKVVASLPIGDRVDAGAFDPTTKSIFCSCGDGTVTVARQNTPDQYAVTETIKTRSGSKTMALDPTTHTLFLPAAEFKAPANGGRGRPAMVPGSFVVLMLGR
jgi:DNA-binding beta-propeller fold protein YncE